MSKSLNILLVPAPGTGHINSCVGIAEVLISSGHKCTFTVIESWRGKLTKFGINEIVIKLMDEFPPNVDPNKLFGEMMIRAGIFGPKTPFEKMSGSGQSYARKLKNLIELNDILEELLKTFSPDVIILDQFYIPPAVILSGIPYVWSWSGNPQYMLDEYDHRAPTIGLGEYNNISINIFIHFKINRAFI